MMYTASEKLAIIRLIEESELSVRRTLREIKISRSSFYRWYRAYEQDGLEGLRGEMSIAELCRREGINTNLYYRWSKDFLEAGKKRLGGDIVGEANTDEVSGLKQENKYVKQAVAECCLRNDWLRKSLTGQVMTLDDE